MTNTPYVPHPIETNDVKLPIELEQLTEQLARNVHETWAQGRVDNGWTYGPVRSDELKQHPCLVEYDNLSEIEKDFDRVTAIGTLKLIFKLGWRLEKAKV